MISCEPSPHSNWSNKAGACDWAMERRGGAGGLGGTVAEGDRREEEEMEANMEQNHMAARNCK